MQRLTFLWILAFCSVGSFPWESTAVAQIPVEDVWQYTFEPPAGGWSKVDFEDSSWATGTAGFGTHGTPAARIGTVWDTSQIWLRKSFRVLNVPKRSALLIHHDEDAVVYLNGKQVASLKGWSDRYDIVELSPEDQQVLKSGVNTLAVHCRQNNGGQFIDVHVIDVDAVPVLPKPPRMTKPFASELLTQWGATLTPENAWTEYPRPQLRRPDWVNLNGEWQYAITSIKQTEVPAKWDGPILVPFSLESKLGGVQYLLGDDEALWYQRTFIATKAAGKRTLLNFEAVDYHAEIILNGRHVGTHVGGNDPFSVDVSLALQDGQNHLVVRVEDATEKWQLRGKQALQPNGIWYTRVSGIWQTVWMEQVADSYIEDVTIQTDAESRSIHLHVDFAGREMASPRLKVSVFDSEKEVATADTPSREVSMTIPNAKLWSPDSPYLYQIKVQLLGESGQVVDTIETYAGIRTIGKVRDKAGHLRMTLNGQPLFHWGPLDQGWWPDGLLTPPSDEAMLFDIQYLKDAGFNMIRKHIKVEPRRYYYHCDRLGMLVWQDQVSGGASPPWTRLAPDPQDAAWPAEPHQQFMLELERMIDSLENHPSIVVWTPFNEAWGQHQSVEVTKWTENRDPSRLVNIASGGNFWPAGDIADHHQYPHPGFPFDANRYADFIKVVGEFGGHGYPVAGHLWDASRNNWGYGGLPKDKAEYKQRYVQSLEILNRLRQQGIAAGVYTQTTDVEGEINGLLTYDRKIIKIPAEELAEMHKSLFQPTSKDDSER
ncbi:glycoside hydrolase family 2 protein [Roseimaritima multifibrata]|nr:sugar-binding domain-containing protein [Roseimaritima multifibrata]